MSKLYFVVFIVIALSVYGGMHWFVYQRIASGLLLTAGQRLALKLFMVAGALSFILAEFVSRQKPIYPLRYIGSVWLGVVAIALAVFLLEALASLCLPGRRRILVLTALAVVFLVSAVSVFNGRRHPVVRRMDVPVRNLPAELDGLTIVHLSDLHLGNLTSIDRLRWIVGRVNSLSPDLICITGDVLDGDICRGAEYCELLLGLKAKHGVLAVTGNHEFYAGIDRFWNWPEKATGGSCAMRPGALTTSSTSSAWTMMPAGDSSPPAPIWKRRCARRPPTFPGYFSIIARIPLPRPSAAASTCSFRAIPTPGRSRRWISWSG